MLTPEIELRRSEEIECGTGSSLFDGVLRTSHPARKSLQPSGTAIQSTWVRVVGEWEALRSFSRPAWDCKVERLSFNSH